MKKNNKLSLREKFISEFGLFANINGEIFNPREVSILLGDESNREITQIMKFLFDSYPIEAIIYILERCLNEGFSRTSNLDKLIKYLLDKYKEPGEIIINNLIYLYKENKLNLDIITTKEFNNKNQQNYGDSELHMTKLVFYDYSKEGVEYKKFQNEIFIKISSEFINKNELLEEENISKKEGSILEENEAQIKFLGKNHHLFNRFCRRNKNIYVQKKNKEKK